MIVWVLFLFTAVLSAAKDTLHHHWYRSIFAKVEEGNLYGYWGPASHGWYRRYMNGRVEDGYVPALRTWWLRAILVPVWDGWHLLKTLRVLCGCAIAVIALGLPMWYVVVSYAIWGAVFEVFYTTVLVRD